MGTPTHLEIERPGLAPYTGKLLTVMEVARILRVEGITVRRWIASGAIEAVKLPNTGRRIRYRVPGEAVDKLLHTPD